MQDNKLQGHSKTVPPSSAPALACCGNFESTSSNELFNNYADIGTLMHKYMENKINGEDTKEIEEKLDIEQVENCDSMLVKLHAFALNKAGEGYNIITEQQIVIYDEAGNYVTHGTSDFTIISQDGQKIIGGDFKADLGFLSSKIEYFPQMCFYSLGLMQKHKLSKIDWCECYIMSGKLKYYDIAYEQSVAMVEAVWNRKYSKTKPEVNYHCNKCKKILTCPAVLRSVNIVHAIYDDIEDRNLIFNPWSINSADDMANVLTICKDVLSPFLKNFEQVIKNVNDAAVEYSKSASIPFYERKSTKRRTIKKIFQAQKTLDIKDNDFEKCLSISIGTLEKKYKDAGNFKSLKEAKEALSEKLWDIIEFGKESQSMKFKKK